MITWPVIWLYIVRIMENRLRSYLRWVVFVAAVAMTTFWLVICIVYFSRLGWDGLLSLAPSDLAAVLAAAAGPPVCLWLILMVIAQQKELLLLQNTLESLMVATRRGNDFLESTGRTLLQSAALSQRQAAQDGLNLALDDLASQAAVVAERLGVLDKESIDLSWARYGSGDRWAFLRPFLDRAALQDGFKYQLARALTIDALSKIAANRFIRRSELLRSNDIVQTDQKLLHEIFEDGPVAQISRLFSLQDNSGSESEELSDADMEETISQEMEEKVGQDSSEDEEYRAPNKSNVDEDIVTEERLGPQPTLF